MTKEQALTRYIKHMQNGVFGYPSDKDKRDYYINWARKRLTTLRLNKRNDPERYNKLENERKGIYQKFRGKVDGENLADTYTDLYDRFTEIDDELTTLWATDPNMPELFA